MSMASPSPVLLLQLPSDQSFLQPPGTVSELTAFVAAIVVTPFDGPLIPEGGSRQVEALLNMMESVATDGAAVRCFYRQALHPASLRALMGALPARVHNLSLSLICRLGDRADEKPAVPAKSGNSGIVQIQWQATRRLPDIGFFKAISRAGIWNHLILGGPAATESNRNTIARQPNIINSWEDTTTDGGNTMADDGYGRLTALPGRPLWQIASDPIHRFMLIDRFGKNWLMRSRADRDHDRIISLGERMDYYFCAPDQLPDGYLDEICAMVAAGGTVAATHVRSNLQKAYLIGYVLENGVIVGNSSLKHPRPQYIESVRRQSGLDLTGFVERGYTSVRPEYRGLGIGTRLLEGLTARAGQRKIFSVIAEDNEATKIIARRNRTRQVASYYSEKAGKPVGIWMPEWMIDNNE